MVDALHTEVEDLYIRRQNVRIFGVKVPDIETSEQVAQIAKDMIREGEIDIPVHRIGKKALGKMALLSPLSSGSLFAGTKFYRGRKLIIQKQTYSYYSIGLELTWKTLFILKEAREEVEGIVRVIN